MVATYLAFAIDNIVEFYFLLNHEIKLHPKNWYAPLVFFLSILQPTKSESVDAFRIKVDSLSNHNPIFYVSFRYIIIFFIAFMWDSIALLWYLVHKHTLNIISGLLVVR